MKTAFHLLTAVLLAAAPGLSAAAPPTVPSAWTGTCAVAFYGTSTLHDFDGGVKSVPLEVTVEASPDGPVVSAAPVVKVAEMNTKNDDRDEKMRAMFQAAAFPQLKLEVVKAPLAKARSVAGGAGSLPVKLTIAGNAKVLAATVTELKETADTVTFTLAFPVSLAAYRLSPPSLMGVVKVGDEVKVKAWVSLKRKK